jgi:hypothetical protein
VWLCANEDIQVVDRNVACWSSSITALKEERSMEPRLVNDEFLPEHYRFVSQDKMRRKGR